MPEEQSEKQEQKSILLRVPEDWYETLRRMAYEEHRSMSELIREALKDKYGLKGVILI